MKNPVLIAAILFCGAILVCLSSCGKDAREPPDPEGPPLVVTPPKFDFQETISREVLENYLARAVSMQRMLIAEDEINDNIRMIRNMGAKFLGRAMAQWCDEYNALKNFETARKLIPHIHAADPEIIVQACIFEMVQKNVELLSIPAWCFEMMDMPVETRKFVFNDMRFTPGEAVGGYDPYDDEKKTTVPDISKTETQLYFLYQAITYIDMGIEALHLGQMDLISRADPGLAHYGRFLEKIRAYAKQHARRGMVICDAHASSPGGYLLGTTNYNLLDFNSAPLRIKEQASGEADAILQLGFSNGLYKRSKGGLTYSGWRCNNLPYLVEFDHWGAGSNPGVYNNASTIYIYGYDEISWFARQTDEVRHAWLQYAYDWVKNTDPNGWLQMPVRRPLTYPTGNGTYNASKIKGEWRDEDVIRNIWRNGRSL